jgi:hypothetical protein
MTDQTKPEPIGLPRAGSPSPIYELVEASTGSLVGTYVDEEQALAAVAATATRSGVEAALTLALGVDDPTGKTDGTLIAKGQDLLTRARRRFERFPPD